MRWHGTAAAWNTPTRLALAATGLEAGLSYGHLLQAPGKRELSAAQLMHFQTRILGPYRVGASLPETFGLASEVVAAWTTRGERKAAVLTSTALVANAAAFAIWAMAIRPINKRLSVWTDDTGDADAPADWQRLRDSWHRLHVLRLALFGVATGALAATPSSVSVRFGIPDRQFGAAEIHEWRRLHGGVPPGRRLRDTAAIDDRTAVDDTVRLPGPAS
jgi:hypothetical protein